MHFEQYRFGGKTIKTTTTRNKNNNKQTKKSQTKLKNYSGFCVFYPDVNSSGRCWRKNCGLDEVFIIF